MRELDARVRRQQVPLTIATASTLYTLQGTTADPGLIYHWKTPRRLSPLMKWLSAYMALSRVRSLKNLRSVGLTDAIKDLINGGPPPGMLTRFLSIFEEKRAETEKIVHSTLLEAGWFKRLGGLKKPLVLLCFRSKMLKNHWFYCVFAQKC